jgi:hypothetical protein
MILALLVAPLAQAGTIQWENTDPNVTSEDMLQLYEDGVNRQNDIIHQCRAWPNIPCPPRVIQGGKTIRLGSRVGRPTPPDTCTWDNGWKQFAVNSNIRIHGTMAAVPNPYELGEDIRYFYTLAATEKVYEISHNSIRTNSSTFGTPLTGTATIDAPDAAYWRSGLYTGGPYGVGSTVVMAQSKWGSWVYWQRPDGGTWSSYKVVPNSNQGGPYHRPTLDIWRYWLLNWHPYGPADLVRYAYMSPPSSADMEFTVPYHLSAATQWRVGVGGIDPDNTLIVYHETNSNTLKVLEWVNPGGWQNSAPPPNQPLLSNNPEDASGVALVSHYLKTDLNYIAVRASNGVTWVARRKGRGHSASWLTWPGLNSVWKSMGSSVLVDPELVMYGDQLIVITTGQDKRPYYRVCSAALPQ